MTYVPLHVCSHFSLGMGTASPFELLDAAAQFGMQALAMTDTANLYGGITFYQEAIARGIRPVLGAEAPVRWEEFQIANCRLETSNCQTDARCGIARVVLLARDHAGYENLCRLITLCHLGHGVGGNQNETSPLDSVSGFERKGRRSNELIPLSPEQLAAHCEGLFVLSDSPELLEALLPLVARESLAAEIVRPSRSISHERALLEFAERNRIRIAGTTAATMLDPDDIRLHRVLTAIQKNELVTQLNPAYLSLPGHTLCSPEEFKERFSDLPGAVRSTIEIADQCRLELSLGKPIFPDFLIPHGETAYSLLQQKCEQGLRWRYSPLTMQAQDRLRYELHVIHKLDFAEYFLVVADIMHFARSREIPSVGRGSGASSIVSYALGITNVDPIRFNIHFERFLNLSRCDCPDIDIDFCWQRRDDVIDYVFHKYGAAHTAMICTHNTFRGRGAFREVAKACGVSNNNVNRLAGKILIDPNLPVEEALKDVPGDIDISDDHLVRIVRHSIRMLGFPHHLSVHCGGIVISPKALDACVPLQRAAKGVIITQFEMNAIEDIGLVKIDLLGNRALSTIDETLRLVREHRGVRLQPEEIPEDDEATFEMIRNGLTVGVNQLESPAMRNLLQMCVPKKIEDIIAALALVRPGAAGGGMKEEYVRRMRGLSQVTFAHPAIEEVLQESLGVMLYEDDAMLIASRVAELSLEQGDRFRKALKKIDTAEAEQRLAGWFLKRCLHSQIPPREARELWDQMVKFQSYSFCKSHACGYGQVALQCAYLKRHHPAEFMVAIMNHHAGMYSKAVHIEEAKRLGVKILLPCVNRSSIAFTVDEGAIRIGLQQVKGLSARTMDEMLQERKCGGLFASLNNFLRRVNTSHPEAESLVLCGALDFTGRPRTELMWELKLTFETERRARKAGRLFHGNFHALRPPRLRDFNENDRIFHELELLELVTGTHILKMLRPSLPSDGIADSRSIRGRIGKPIRLIGMLDATRRVDTGCGDRMEFLTLEDEHGLWECTLFPSAYRRFGKQIGPWGPYLVEGKVEEQYGAITVTLNGLKLLGAEGE